MQKNDRSRDNDQKESVCELHHFIFKLFILLPFIITWYADVPIFASSGVKMQYKYMIIMCVFSVA